jgi:hypothetical protein
MGGARAGEDYRGTRYRWSSGCCADNFFSPSGQLPLLPTPICKGVAPLARERRPARPGTRRPGLGARTTASWLVERGRYGPCAADPSLISPGALSVRRGTRGPSGQLPKLPSAWATFQLLHGAPGQTFAPNTAPRISQKFTLRRLHSAASRHQLATLTPCVGLSILRRNGNCPLSIASFPCFPVHQEHERSGPLLLFPRRLRNHYPVNNLLPASPLRSRPLKIPVRPDSPDSRPK